MRHPPADTKLTFMMNKTLEVPSSLFVPDESSMLELGSKIADYLPDAGVVFLTGDLGAGKTTLVRGVLQSLGHQGIVKSPTYTLVEPYRVNGRDIYHFDLYRLADPEEIEYLGGRDYFNANSLCFIEWPAQAKGFLPAPDLNIELEHLRNGRSAHMS